MRVCDLYRGLLLLYPRDFRSQFSEEMISVFQQRVSERPETLKLFLMEFFSIPKGACIMWLAKILTRNPWSSEAEGATCTPVTVAELNSRRQTAIKKMVVSIARHDFLNARRYSYEEVRLKRVLRDLEDGVSAPESQTAE